jgi:NTE family protein
MNDVNSSRSSTNGGAIRIVMLVAFIITMAIFMGCARYPLNPRLEHYDLETQGKASLQSPERSEELMVILAFSGGGTRASALSYGVLEAMGQVEIPIPQDVAASGESEGPYTLLDEVDAISSVSGGSFTAAYYCLHQKRAFDDFKERMLYHNINRGLIGRLVLPTNWPRLGSLLYGRSDMAAEYYDQILFEGATYSDIWEQNGPELMIQATDIADGIRFGFTRYHFSLICSDLAEFPIARAVSASSAFPGPFNGITLKNHAGTCGYEELPWVAEALNERDTTSRTFYTAQQARLYQNPEEKAFVHLLDGGIADNIGIRGPLELLIAFGGARETLEYLGLEDTRRMVFIIVNAEGETQNNWGLSAMGPRVMGMLGATSSIMISSYNYETIALLRQYVEEWSAENRDLEKGESPIDFYAIEVGFNALQDEQERMYFSSIPTSLALPRQSVDDLREVARRILFKSKEFQKLVHDLGGTIPTPEDQESLDE